MDLTKDITYEHFKNIKLQKTREKEFKYNELLNEVIESPILISIDKNQIRFLKNKHGCTGDLGSGELLNTMISLIGQSLDSDVKLFKESFLNDLHKAVKQVLKHHEIDLDAYQFFKRRSEDA